MGIISYFCGYYFTVLYALIHLIVQILKTSKTFSNKLASFKNDQEIIKKHYLKDFKVFYYLNFTSQIITAGVFFTFMFLLSAESIEEYNFIFLLLRVPIS